MARKTWNEKLKGGKNLPAIVAIDEKMAKRFGPGTMVVPSPMEVDEIMRHVEEGRLITTEVIRAKLARKHGTVTACPLCTGIFINIAAHAAEENKTAGNRGITPYWRTLKSSGQLNEKYPDGIDHQKMLLEMEGHKIKQQGNKYFVEDYEQHLTEVQ